MNLTLLKPDGAVVAVGTTTENFGYGVQPGDILDFARDTLSLIHDPIKVRLLSKRFIFSASVMSEQPSVFFIVELLEAP